jgi:low affinity Fe/Cu permease
MRQNHQQTEQHPHRVFASIANKASQAAGRASTFVLALAAVFISAITGPLSRFADTTTIVTFLMVFLIQNSQNRDSAAIQLKLDELIRAGIVQ